MSERVLPEGWSLCQLVDLGDIVTGKTPSTKENDNFGGGIPFIKPGDLDAGGYVSSTETTLTPKGLLAINEIPADTVCVTCIGNIGKVGMARSVSATNQQINSFIARDGVDVKYVYYYIKSMKGWLEKESSATTVSIVNKSKFSKLPFLFPPKAEQKAIADKLDELLAQVNNLKTRLDAIPAILKRFRQSVLAAAVSGKLTEEWRKEKRLRPALEVELGSLINEGPQNGIYKPSSAYGEGVRIIRIDGFYDGELVSWSGMRRLEISCEELDKWRVNTGDILINRVNSIEYLGKCALVRGLSEDAVFESNIMRFSVDPEKSIPEYVMRCVSSRTVKRQLVGKAKHAVNQASINQKDVKSCVIPLPHIEEQAEIVRRVEQLFAFADQVEQQLGNAQARVDKLTQSILAKAFRGELTAEWRAENPELISGEHSAEALLERIKAEKAKQKPAGRGRKTSTYAGASA